MDYVANLLDESSSFSFRGGINLFITNKNKNPVGYSKLGRYYGTHSWQSKQKKIWKMSLLVIISGFQFLLVGYRIVVVFFREKWQMAFIMYA